MGLYLIQHTHPAETCPRKNPELARELFSHITQTNAGKHGVKLLADWVNQAEHTVILVLETDTPEKALQFALPFLKVGSLTIKEGLTCDEVATQCLGQ